PAAGSGAVTSACGSPSVTDDEGSSVSGWFSATEDDRSPVCGRFSATEDDGPVACADCSWECVSGVAAGTSETCISVRPSSAWCTAVTWKPPERGENATRFELGEPVS